MRKNTVYSDWEMFDLIDDESYWESIKCDYDMSDEEFKELDKWDWIYNEMELSLDAERENLNIDVHSPIIAIADLGLWDGRVTGYKEINSSNIANCLYTDRDIRDAEWFCDAYDFRAKMAHHDGTNYILYRMRKENVSDTQWETFLWKIYEGKANRADITRYTKSLMPYIAKVYGWKYRDYSRERKVA